MNNNQLARRWIGIGVFALVLPLAAAAQQVVKAAGIKVD